MLRESSKDWLYKRGATLLALAAGGCIGAGLVGAMHQPKLVAAAQQGPARLVRVDAALPKSTGAPALPKQPRHRGRPRVTVFGSPALCRSTRPGPAG
jgi:hypothetical protein